MGMCEGNWRSEVKWEKQDGQPPEDKDYTYDGMLHVCPYSDGKPIQGQYIQGDNSYPLENAACEQAGEGRFKVKFQLKTAAAAGGKTYSYEGSGRLMHKVDGPAFVYGTVTSGDADSGTWEAVRVGPAHGPGPGEGPEAGTSEGSGGGH